MSSPLPEIPVEEPKVSLRAVQSPWTGYVGLAALAINLGVAVSWERGSAEGLVLELWTFRYFLALFATAVAMMVVEVAVFRVHRRHFDFSRPGRVVDASARKRILQRWLATALLLAAGWGLYIGFNHYRLDEYLAHDVFGGPQGGRRTFVRFYDLLLWLTPGVLLIAPAYFWVGERWGRDDPEDPNEEFLLLYRAATRSVGVVVAGVARMRVKLRAWQDELVSSATHPNFKNLTRWWLVKFFFLPWMTIWFVGNCEVLARDVHIVANLFDGGVHRGTLTRAYQALLNVLFLVDLTFAAIGYALTVKLLDTHVKSAEPTFFGWFVALACYPPFNNVTNQFIPYGGDGAWMGMLSPAETPLWLFTAWAVVILVLLGIYTWATVVFGLRFSNLTNRGILSRGPYAIVRHPAYISKNTAWWLMAVPFMSTSHAVFGLLAWNLMYFLRAITEERHLKQDPHYREYCEKVRWRFIPGLF